MLNLYSYSRFMLGYDFLMTFVGFWTILTWHLTLI